jgi:hypothetical protein
MDDPTSSRAAQLVAGGILAVILVSCTAFVLQTLPQYAGETSAEFAGIELACVIIFSVEFALRVSCTPSLARFVASPLNVVDFLAILPFYVEVRGVVWGDLTLLFSDESNVAAGRRHFFYYSYGPAFGAQVNPFGMHTEAGITVGSPLKQLKAAYPSVVVYTDDPAGVTFSIDDTLTGSLSGPGANAVVTNINGGVGCGE